MTEEQMFGIIDMLNNVNATEGDEIMERKISVIEDVQERECSFIVGGIAN